MPTRLLTGATDGVGLELARVWSAREGRFFLHGRRPLLELDVALFDAGHYVQADLADAAAPERIVRFLDERGVEALDLLVMNAACGWVGPIDELDAIGVRALLEIDLLANLRLCHLLLPRLRRARGRILFVSSIAAGMAAPRYAVYAAAKAAAEGFFRSLAVELAGDGPADAVEVQVVRLGAVRTRLHEKSGLSPAEIPWERFPSPQSVARAIDGLLARSPRWRTLGIGNKLVSSLARALPAVVDRFVHASDSRARDGDGRARSAALPGARCVITGGAQGIGRALAGRFARAGFALTLIDVDRRAAERARAELEGGGTKVELLIADLARADEVERLAEELVRRPPCDVFVHNAGINAVGRFAELPWDEQRRVLEVNLVAPLVLTGALLRAGRLAPGGTLVFVSSLSRFLSYPGASVYAASKDGLAHFARSLRAALRPSGARVLTVYPGPTRTEHARRHSPDNSREARRMPPEELAARILRALERRRSVLVPGPANWLLAALGHLAPGLAERAMKRAILDELGRTQVERSALPTSSARR